MARDSASETTGSDERRTLVLGIGNVLWADEGFGVRAVEALHNGWQVPPEVTLMDGGTQGLILLADVTAHSHVLVFDSIDFGDPPGTLRVLRDRDVPSWAGAKMSLHQQSFMELLSIADMQGRFPPHLTVVGVQPERLMDFGGSLTDCVRAQLEPALALAIEELRRWGHAPQPRTEPPAERLNDVSLNLNAYESGRPAADAACRIGDARFLNIRAGAEQAAAEGAR